ncbi:putative transcriptional regulator [Cupriavidus taiwanensis]|uniref:Transcriptional regulator n=1 Tax=Cupriavidus taiwanensis TaxID=164546 RepID=A0A976A3K1_9BURK|nr:IclR family transcriptional regulator [Cupriavidus taiwanensis]SOY58569.1 putative transcriptional regulator [Cupriavidus taiwanensis]
MITTKKQVAQRPAETLVAGTQSLSRALTLLKCIGAAHERGIELAELLAATGLDRSTAFRLVSGLVQAGFVEREADTRKYRLGIESMQLGLTAMSRAPVLISCRPMLQSLARQTEDTVFLVIRNGDYGHCLHMEEGSYPIKAHTLMVGSLRLLGIGTAGLALLARLPDTEIDALYRRHREEYDAAGLTRLRLLELVARSRKQGYSESENLVTAGAGGVGAAFEISRGNYAALSVASVMSRMNKPRRSWVAGLVLEEIRKREMQLNSAG